jgi:hypothetical protein
MSKQLIFASIFVAAFWGLVISLMPKHSVVAYDCSLAEISPDFPVEVKEQCRKMRSGRI